MSSITQTRTQTPRSPSRDLVPAAIRLIGHQIRQTWRMLTVMAVGLLITVAMVGTLPLFARITETAGLRNFITQDPNNLNIVAEGQSYALTNDILNGFSQVIAQHIQGTIQPYLQPIQYIATQTANAEIQSYTVGGKTTGYGGLLSLVGVDVSQMTPQLHVVKGRLPAAHSSMIEIAVNQQTAAILDAPVGSIITIQFKDNRGVNVPIHLVGVIAQPTTPQQFWKDNPIDSFIPDNAPPMYVALASTSTVLDVLANIATNAHDQGANLQVVMRAYWMHVIDPNTLDATQLDATSARFDSFQTQTISDLSISGLGAPTVQGPIFDPNGLLSIYSARITNAQISVIVLYGGLIGAALLFVSLLAEILIEQQSSSIAVLRSRGFGRGQLFAALAVQGVVVCAAAFILGAILAIPLARQLALWNPPSGQQSAVQVLAGAPMQVLAPAMGPMLVALACAVVALLLAFFTALRQNILSLRREAARAVQVPLWQRLHLDVLVGVLALVGLLSSLYLQATVIGTDPQTDRLLAPISLVAPMCALIVIGLLFVRGSQLLVRLGARLAQQGRGALAMLALTQMERAPRQVLRLTLFLALALAYAVFALTFTASQTLRADDVATQNVGADFGGYVTHFGIVAKPTAMNCQPNSQAINCSLATETATFRHISGVTSATVGHTAQLQSADSQSQTQVTVLAVDAHTYGQTARWPAQDGASVPLLMQQLIQAAPTEGTYIPAIVDTLTWNRLHLSMGATFDLNDNTNNGNQAIHYKVIAKITSLPQAPLDTGGILVDFSAYATALLQYGPTPILLNYVWLRTSDDPAAVASVRTAINTAGPTSLFPFVDRRAIAFGLRQEPLTLTLEGLLVICVGIPLGLALIGTFIAAWQHVRQRLASMTVLRSLGAAPRQISSVLVWEQGFSYILAVILGTGIGILFAYLSLPNLILTNVLPNQQNTTTNLLYLAQHTPSVRSVFPASIWWASLGLLLCGLMAIGLLQLIARRSALGQTLRLNED